MERELFTVGHSVHALPHFFALLRTHTIEVIADVRTKPYSRHVPQFNYESIRAAAIDAGFRYVYLGRELGGYPANPDGFPAGIERLLTGITKFRVAAMCAEEDPAECHRHRLIGAALHDAGIPVHHIRADGWIESWEAVETRRAPQPPLFS
jgi:uncharacterized protein (DUF488 family)